MNKKPMWNKMEVQITSENEKDNVRTKWTYKNIQEQKAIWGQQQGGGKLDNRLSNGNKKIISEQVNYTRTKTYNVKWKADQSEGETVKC